MLGVALLAILIPTHLRSNAEARSRSRRLLMLLIALAFFAVVVDMVHILASGWTARILAVVEDGGELVVLSVIACAVLGMASRARDAAAAPEAQVLETSGVKRALSGPLQNPSWV